jgi:hypothetical protein
MKELLEKYAELKLVIKEAEKEIEKLQPEIKEQLELDVKYEIDNAVVTLSPGKPRWVYSEATIIADEDLKKTKKEEEQMGIASQVLGEPFILCTFKKNK